MCAPEFSVIIICRHQPNRQLKQIPTYTETLSHIFRKIPCANTILIPRSQIMIQNVMYALTDKPNPLYLMSLFL